MVVGAFVFVSFISGCVTTAVLLRHKEKITNTIQNVKFFLGYKDALVSNKYYMNELQKQFHMLDCNNILLQCFNKYIILGRSNK